jgi:hypothetical protein
VTDDDVATLIATIGERAGSEDTLELLDAAITAPTERWTTSWPWRGRQASPGRSSVLASA